MSFNKGYELKKFEAHWEKLRIEYAAAGMMEDAVQKMYDYEAHPFPRPAPQLRQSALCQWREPEGNPRVARSQ